MKQLIAELQWRGLLFDATPELEDRLAEGPITGYVGFDPTAPSLQIGNLVPLTLLSHLQRHGGRPIILMGGGTGMIGDPSGKQSERPLLEGDQIDENVARQKKQMEQYLDFDDPDTGAIVLNNADWLRDLNLIEFLRDTGKHFTISQMLQKESIKTRLESGISYAEFSYLLLQSYDFLHLFRAENCELQMGGSDQWGNITAGADLIRRVTGKQAHALCAPLLTTSTGAKFGKSEAGAMWLDPDMTSPYAFYQYWLNADDKDVAAWLKIFTLRTRDDIASLMERHVGDPGARIPHKTLARDLTERVHSAKIADDVVAASELIFGKGEIREAGASVWKQLSRELPSHEIGAGGLPVSVVDLIAESGLVKSKGEARRQLKQGGIYVNQERVEEHTTIDPSALLDGGYLWIRRGKKNHVIVKVN